MMVATLKAVLLSAAFGLVVALSVTADPPAEQASSTPYVTRLAAGLDCWGSDGEQHPFPTRVIYHRGGDWRVGGPRVVDQALEQIFDGVDHDLEVYRFCVARGALASHHHD